MPALAILALRLAQPPQALILEGAKAQLARPAQYTHQYFTLKYPGGDPPANFGACTDVVVRAMRFAGTDLQVLVHQDAGRAKYPHIGRPDTNIDHRRCPNLDTFFRRHGRNLPLDRDFEPGDIVFWKLPVNVDHVGIVSDKIGVSGNLDVIHNVRMTMQADVLHAWPIVGHYRYP